MFQKGSQELQVCPGWQGLPQPVSGASSTSMPVRLTEDAMAFPLIAIAMDRLNSFGGAKSGGEKQEFRKCSEFAFSF
jgi:hypothetical protein